MRLISAHAIVRRTAALLAPGLLPLVAGILLNQAGASAAVTNSPASPRKPRPALPATVRTNPPTPLDLLPIPGFAAAAKRFLEVPRSPAGASNNLPTLARVRDILDLGADGARLRPHPVRILGVATTHAVRGTSFFVHDGSGSIQAVATFTDQLPSDLIGHAVWVEGIAGNGPLKPWIAEARVEVLGVAPLPPPTAVPFADILSGRWHGERVVTEGTVRDILRGNIFVLLLANSGNHLEVEVLHRGPRLGPIPMRWYQSRMSVTGVVLTDVDTRGRPSVTRLLVRDARDLHIQRRYPTNLFDMPVTPSSAHRPDPNPKDELVKLEGTVLHHASDQRLFIRDTNGAFQASPLELLPQRGTRVTTIERPPAQRFSPGDRIEIVGVRAPSTFAPVFIDAEYRRRGRDTPPVPIELTVEEAVSGRHDADLITLRGRLVGRETRTVDHVLHEVLRLQSGKVVFEALVERSTNSPLPDIPPDTHVRLTGLGVLSQLSPGGPRSLRLWLRSPTDLAILGPAAPWELVPPIRIFAASGTLGAAAAGWIIFLRRQVRQRRRAEAVARESEASARILNEELERRISVRTAELVAANARLLELSELKSRFVSMVSHEFRTPLGVITSSAEILDAYLDRLPPEERTANLRDITDATRQMSRMMEEVLLIGRAEAGKLECHPVPLDLAGLVHRVVTDVSTTHNRRCPIHLCLPSGLPLARGDESLLRHILTNLLSNAVKYSPDGAPVQLRLRERNGIAYFSVRDFGIGIPDSDQPLLFEAFHRGRNVGQTQGTGLGMTIVRRCVEVHSGRISFHSREGAGSRFSVALPLFKHPFQ